MGKHVEPKSNRRPRRPKRRWWQIALRTGVLAAAVLGVLYATLPWWVPTGFLAGRLERALGRELSLPVRIGRMEMSWSNGVTVSDARIGNSAEFGGGDLAVVKSIRCDFSPLHLLWCGRLKWMELTDVQLRVVVLEDGRMNIAALRPLVEMPPPGWLAARRAGVTVQLPQHDRLLRLDVADLQYRLGRLENVGRITMSAALNQTGKSAPMTLLGSVGNAGSKDPAAEANFRFADLDISQLNLPRLLDLPLDRLAGRASGQIDCRFNHSGLVERFSLCLRVRDLDAKARGGPALPVIRQAEISLTATSDPIYKSIDARTFRLRLPGIDLSGEGRIHTDALAGRWEAVRSLEVTGLVNPTTVAALLWGRPPLPGGMEVEGDVKVNVSLHGDQSQMSFSAVLDATDAALRAGPRVAKPAGRTLAAEIRGHVEKHTWRFLTDRSELRIGKNRFLGSGTIRNVRRVLNRWSNPGEKPTPAAVLNDLSGLDWQGRWEIVELESLRDLLGGLTAGRWSIPEPVRLEGRITGQWYVNDAPDARAAAVGLRGIHLPAGTRLTVGKWFVKPPDKAMEMELAGAVTTNPPSLRRLRFRAGVGRAGVSIEEGLVTFSPADGPEAEGLSLRAEGRYSIHGIGELLGCIPAAKDWKNRLDGSLTGPFSVILSPSMKRLHAETNATQLKVDIGETFVKTAGQPAEITVDFQADDALHAVLRNRLALRIRLGSAAMDGSVVFPSADAAKAPIRCFARLRVADAAWLLQRTTGLERMLRSRDVRGSMTASLRAEIGGDFLAGDLVCDADDIQLRLPRWSPRATRLGEPSTSEPLSIKPRGDPLRLRLAGRIERKTATISALSLDVGRSSLRLTGSARLAEAPAATNPPAGTYWPPPGLASAEMNIRGRLVLDPTAKAILPDIARLAERYGVSGAVRLGLRVRSDGGQIDARGELDASDITVAFESEPRSRPGAAAAGTAAPKTPPLAGRIGEAVHEIVGRFRKPAGSRARARFELTVPADFSRLQLRDLFIDADTFQVRANATIPLLDRTGPARSRRGWPAPDAAPPSVAHVALSVPDLARLRHRLPRLARYRPSGSVLIEGQFRRDGPGVIDYATIRINNAAATIASRRCGLNGTVLFEEVALSERPSDKAPAGTIGRIATDSLEFSIGDSHGFVVADVRSPADGPSGRFNLLCTNLDAYDLQQWAYPDAISSASRDAARGDPLTKAGVESLGRRADATIKRIGDLLGSADLKCRVQIDRLRHLDPAIRAFYEPRGMIAEANVKNGKISAGFRCGLNGGIMEQNYSLDLNRPDVRVAVKADLAELLTGENIIAQVAREFPGNTFYGTFSQSKEVTYPLRDLLMEQMDTRYRAIPVGIAKTVAVDGMVRGKGGPRWMTRFFPGLNLTTYRYRKMTGFAEYLPDGTAGNDMIFSGAAYDIYMTGATDAENIARYNIGVILLAAPQSPEFNHAFRQGRIPILNFKARIVNQRFQDEQVWYPWPTETAYKIFLENNIFYRLWLNATKKPNAAIIADESAK